MAHVSWRGSDPFNAVSELQATLDRLRQNPALGLDLGPSAPSVFPPLNVFRDPQGALVVRAEIPGIDPAGVDVRIEPQRLTVSGERSAEPARAGGYHRRERRFGRFSRSVQLPADLDPTRTSARYADGLLTIQIEKADAARARKVAVSTS
jgi:HSP20 family protein